MATQQVEERTPDSGKPIVTTPAPLDQVGQAQAMTAHIQAKMAAGEELTEQEKAHMDSYAEAIRQVEVDLEQVKSGKLSLFEMMSRIANQSGVAYASVAPTSTPATAQEVSVPRNSDVSGLAHLAAAENESLEGENVQAITAVDATVPVTETVQRGVTLVVDEAPASEEAKKQMEKQDTILSQPAYVPTENADPEIPVVIESSAQPEAVSPLPTSSKSPSGRPSRHPNAQLTMSTTGNYYEISPSNEVLASTGDTELDAEFAAFQHMTLRSENVAILDSKRRIKDVLDTLEIEEIRHREESEYINRKKGSSKLANLGGMIKGIFHTVESVISPKAALYRNAKTQQERDMAEARESLDRDIQRIRTGNDAISEYVDRSFGITFTFDTTNNAELGKFIESCKNPSNSGHYQAVKRIINEHVEARIAEYNLQMEKIQSDPGYKQNIDEMLYGSAATENAEATNGSLYLRMKERLSGWFGSDKKERLERPSWIDKRIAVPLLGSEIMFTPPSQKAKLIDPQNIDSRDETTQIVNIDNLRARQTERKTEERKRKGGWLLAAAGALGLIGLSGFGIHKAIKDLDSRKDSSSEVAEGPKTAPTATPTASAAAVSTPVANVDAPKEGEQSTPAPKLTDSKPEKVAKSPIIVRPAPKLAKVIINNPSIADKPQPKAEKPEVKVDEKTELTLDEKATALTKADSKISAYKRKVDLLLGSDFKVNPAEEEKLIGLISQVTEQMKSLRTKGDLQKMDNTYAAIEADLNKLEKERTNLLAPKYIADAEVNAKIAQDKLQVIKGLMSGKGTKFTIHHTVSQAKDGKTTSTLAMPYVVDLAQIEAKLKQIAERNSVGNSRTVTEAQARMDAADAQYWVGYLKFVDWYARYRLNGVDVTFDN